MASKLRLNMNRYGKLFQASTNFLDTARCCSLTAKNHLEVTSRCSRHSSTCNKTTVCTDVHRGSRVRIKTYDCSPNIGPLDYLGQISVRDSNVDCMIVKHCENCSVRVDLRDGEPKNFRLDASTAGTNNVSDSQREDGQSWDLVQISPQKTDDGKKTVRCTIHNEPHAELCGCHIQLPAHVLLDLQCDGDADLTISQLEFTRCRITCAGGMSTLRKIRCSNQLELYCRGAVTINDYCEGDIVIKTVSNRGFVRANGRLAGDNITIDTESGQIQCDSVYAKELHAHTLHSGGNIVMKNVHGNAAIAAESGNIHIASHEGGNLSVKTRAGNIRVDLVKSKVAILETMSGAIEIGVPRDDAGDDAVYLNLKSDRKVILDPAWSAVEGKRSFSSGNEDHDGEILEWQGIVPPTRMHPSRYEESVSYKAGKIDVLGAERAVRNWPDESAPRTKNYDFNKASIQVHAAANNGVISVKEASWFGNLFTKLEKVG